MQTSIPNDGVFKFDVAVRHGGLRVAIPAPIVRGLVHVGWQGRWLDVLLSDDQRFKAAVRPHPTAVMFALPKRFCGALIPGDRIHLEIEPARGPAAPTKRCVRGRWIPATATLNLPWLRST